MRIFQRNFDQDCGLAEDKTHKATVAMATSQRHLLSRKGFNSLIGLEITVSPWS